MSCRQTLTWGYSPRSKLHSRLCLLPSQVEKDRNRIETLFRDTEAIRQRVHLQEQVKLCEAKVEYLTWLEARAKHAESESMLQKAQAKVSGRG